MKGHSSIGAALLLVAVFLLSSSCAQVQPHFSVPKMTLSDPSFIPTMEAYTASTVSAGNRVDFLLNGNQIFPAQLAASPKSWLTPAPCGHAVDGRGIFR